MDKYKGKDVQSQQVNVMTTSYTAAIKQEGEWWIGWVEEVPGVNCQEATREELLESLRVTLAEASVERNDKCRAG
jgi:hypothetical protein